MSEKLRTQFPTQGWKQFLTSRKDMLDAFDSAREKAKSHEVETYHGKVAESEFRKWLINFLPKRYGVTSGYIISTGIRSDKKAPHFDVIIYDQLESPILWVEDDPDVSSQGRSLAIPVEYVKAVLEVKSNFSPKSVTEALEHLGDLSPLMSGLDEPSERYKLHLPQTFCCGLIFFDLKKEFEYSESTLLKFLSGIQYRGFFGGIILRGEGHTLPFSGKIRLLHSEEPIEGIIGPGKASMLQTSLTQTVQIADNLHMAAILTWSEIEFSQFAFDLVAIMQGTYDVGRVSSFYGMGTTQWENALQKDDK